MLHQLHKSSSLNENGQHICLSRGQWNNEQIPAIIAPSDRRPMGSTDDYQVCVIVVSLKHTMNPLGFTDSALGSFSETAEVWVRD